MTAWRTNGGDVILGHREPPTARHRLDLPCGRCIGCQTTKAKGWALRCTLELQKHNKAAFTTLTYSDKHLPATLAKSHLQLWLKRLRKKMGPARPIRFFACGEYGEQRGRPHYHAILYGASAQDRDLVHHTWGLGHTKTVDVTPAAIAYVAGYSAKKIGDMMKTAEERIDYNTGEVYRWQPPFLQMSRRPGIGGHARQFTSSWRSCAIHNGQPMPVPRFLHEAWRKTATEDEIEELSFEKTRLILNRHRANREAEEQNAIARQALQADRRKLE